MKYLIPRRTSFESLTSTRSSKNPRSWTKVVIWKKRRIKTTLSQRRAATSSIQEPTTQSSSQRARKTNEARRMIQRRASRSLSFSSNIAMPYIIAKECYGERKIDSTLLDVISTLGVYCGIWIPQKLEHVSLVWLGITRCGLNAAAQKTKQQFGDILWQTLSYFRTNAFFL